MHGSQTILPLDENTPPRVDADAWARAEVRFRALDAAAGTESHLAVVTCFKWALGWTLVVKVNGREVAAHGEDTPEDAGEQVFTEYLRTAGGRR